MTSQGVYIETGEETYRTSDTQYATHLDKCLSDNGNRFIGSSELDCSSTEGLKELRAACHVFLCVL